MERLKNLNSKLQVPKITSGKQSTSDDKDQSEQNQLRSDSKKLTDVIDNQNDESPVSDTSILKQQMDSLTQNLELSFDQFFDKNGKQPDNKDDRLVELSIKNPQKSKFDSKIDELHKDQIDNKFSKNGVATKRTAPKRHNTTTKVMQFSNEAGKNPINILQDKVSSLAAIEEEPNAEQTKNLKFVCAELSSVQRFSQFLASKINEVAQKGKQFEKNYEFRQEAVNQECQKIKYLAQTQNEHGQSFKTFSDKLIELEKKLIKNNYDALKADTIPLQTTSKVLHIRVEEIQEQMDEIQKKFKLMERELDQEKEKFQKLSTKQQQENQVIITIVKDTIDQRMSMFRSLMQEQVLKVAKESFILKEELKSESGLRQDQYQKLTRDIESRCSILPKLTSDLKQHEADISKKVSQEEFNKNLENLPSKDQLLDLKLDFTKKFYTNQKSIENFNAQINQWQVIIDNQTKIVGRYDEILCDKASKISFEEFKIDCSKKLNDFAIANGLTFKSAADLRTLYVQLQGQMQDAEEQITYQANQILQLHPVPQQIFQIENQLDQINWKLKMKVNIDDFEQRVNLKSNKTETENIQIQLHELQNQVQTFAVLLSESLKLHQQRVDETFQQKQNKLNHFSAQVQKLARNITVDLNDKPIKNVGQEMPTQIHNAMPYSNRRVSTARGRISQPRKVSISKNEAQETVVNEVKQLISLNSPCHNSISRQNLKKLSHSSTTDLHKPIVRQKQDFFQSPKSDIQPKVPFIVSKQNKKAAKCKLLFSREYLRTEE